METLSAVHLVSLQLALHAGKVGIDPLFDDLPVDYAEYADLGNLHATTCRWFSKKLAKVRTTRSEPGHNAIPFGDGVLHGFHPVWKRFAM